MKPRNAHLPIREQISHPMTLEQFKARAREEANVRNVVANPWFRYAESHNLPDAELELIKQLIDINTIQIESILDTQFDKLMEEVKGMVMEKRSGAISSTEVGYNLFRAEFLRRLSAFKEGK